MCVRPPHRAPLIKFTFPLSLSLPVQTEYILTHSCYTTLAFLPARLPACLPAHQQATLANDRSNAKHSRVLCLPACLPAPITSLRHGLHVAAQQNRLPSCAMCGPSKEGGRVVFSDSPPVEEICTKIAASRIQARARTETRATASLPQ